MSSDLFFSLLVSGSTKLLTSGVTLSGLFQFAKILIKNESVHFELSDKEEFVKKYFGLRLKGGLKFVLKNNRAHA